MARLVGVFRLGRDAELVDGDNGKFLSLSLAYDVYVGGSEKPQWVRATLGGKKAENLAPHLKKGSSIFATIENLHVREFNRDDGTKGSALEGRVLGDIDFVGAKREEAATA